MKHLFLPLFLIYCLAVWACEDDCKQGEERCYDNTVEICGSNGEWYMVTDCNVAGEDWVCCEAQNALWCLPPERCDNYVD